jgi:cytochrome P450
VGQALARMEIHVALATLLAQHSFRLDDSLGGLAGLQRSRLVNRLTLQAAGGVPMAVARRRQ